MTKKSLSKTLFREIAQMLRLPESTVKSRSYRALDKMKRHMTGG